MVVERPNDLLTFCSANCIDLMSFGFFCCVCSSLQKIEFFDSLGGRNRICLKVSFVTIYVIIHDVLYIHTLCINRHSETSGASAEMCTAARLQNEEWLEEVLS